MERETLKDLHVEGREILKLILKILGKNGSRFIWLNSL
jgi:hypothetical protein